MSWRDHYPFASHYVQLTESARLHYIDQGVGPVLLMSHGNPTWSFYYRNLIRGLSDDFRVIAVDHLGCGLSDKPQSYDYCLAQHTDNLLQLAAELELQDITIVGHDWGGAIGLNAVRRSSELFARVVMFNTGAFPPQRIPWRIAACRTPVLGPLAVRGANAFGKAALRMTMVKPEQMSDDERAGMIAPYNNWANRVAIQKFVDDIPLTRRHRTWAELQALENALPTMTHLPALLIWGMQDWCFDAACLDRFSTYWPHAQVRKITDAGHWVVEDAAEQIVPAIRNFLNQHALDRHPPSPDASMTSG